MNTGQIQNLKVQNAKLFGNIYTNYKFDVCKTGKVVEYCDIPQVSTLLQTGDSSTTGHKRSTPERRGKWKSVLWSDRSTFQISFGNNGCQVLQAKEEKDHRDCFLCKVQKPHL